MGRAGRRRRRDHHRGRGQGRLRARRPGVLRLREPLEEPGRRHRLHRQVDQHRPMSALEPGQDLPELKVTPGPVVEKIDKIKEQTKVLRIYFNNHYGGKAVINALEFKEMLGFKLSEKEASKLESAKSYLGKLNV